MIGLEKVKEGEKIQKGHSLRFWYLSNKNYKN